MAKTGAELKKIREKYENRIYELMDDLDPSGYNSDVYKTSFSRMSDKEFIELMKKIAGDDDTNISMDFKQFEQNPKYKMSLERIRSVAKKWKIRLTEYVFMPFRNPNGQPMVTLSRVPIIYSPVRRFFQQMLQHKNNIVNDNSKINPITGQVVNEDKAASLTNVQTYAMTVTNQKNVVKELLGPRADDPVSKQQMLSKIEQDGEVSLEDLDISTHNKQSMATAEVYAAAACMDLRFGKN
jgi:hypothetical protein